jgi:hemoglobin/transferrin/lactoferrin receptor protein
MLASLLLASSALCSMAMPAQAAAQAGNSFNIPAQPLGDALADFGAQSKLQVSVNAASVRGLSARPVQGTMSPTQALARLLAGSGYSGRIEDGVVTLFPQPQGAQGAVQLGPLQVEGQQTNRTAGEERDARGADDVYDRDTTTTYMGKDEIERYKGVNPSDMLKGMLGVYSGDPRNGGAIDPSIRGISGPGRVPVIIDGTEQALTVWRGYNGASNRAYIDPSLVSGLQIEKGPVSTRGVDGSIGGAVVVHTLDADDILRKGKTFGIEMKLEGGDNSTSPRWPTSLNGQNYTTVPGFPASPSFPYADPSLNVTPRTSDNNRLFSLGDRAVRVAAAARLGDVDLFGAYAYRSRGNYFSGGDGAGYYQQSSLSSNPGNFIQRMGLQYLPGNEVTNTSSETSSWLAKLVWHINDASYLKAGFRDTSATYGDILSSRLITGGVNLGAIQWPASHVHTQAYNLDYRLQPNLWWLDLKVNLWGTHTRSATNSLGGFPNAATTTDPILTNTAVAHNRNDRFGGIVSNQFKLGKRLDLLVEGNWQHEVLRSNDQIYTTASCSFCQYPRSGSREEYKLNFKGEWRPTSFLKLNAGWPIPAMPPMTTCCALWSPRVRRRRTTSIPVTRPTCPSTSPIKPAGAPTGTPITCNAAMTAPPPPALPPRAPTRPTTTAPTRSAGSIPSMPMTTASSPAPRTPA